MDNTKARVQRALLRSATVLVLGTAALLLLQYPIALIRIVLATLSGTALGAVDSTGVFHSLIAALDLDPVYGSIAAGMLTGLQVHGIAISGVVGEWLHSTLPAVFASPGVLPPDDWLGGVVAPGGPITARFLAVLLAEMLLLVAGSLITLTAGRLPGSRGGWRQVIPGFGILLQAAGFGGLLVMVFSPPDYEGMGLAPVINKLFGAKTMSSYRQIAAWLVPLVAVVVPLLALAVSYGAILAVRLARSRHVAFGQVSAVPRAISGRFPSQRSVVLVGTLALVQVVLIMTGSVARADLVSDRVADLATPTTSDAVSSRAARTRLVFPVLAQAPETARRMGPRTGEVPAAAIPSEPAEVASEPAGVAPEATATVPEPTAAASEPTAGVPEGTVVEGPSQQSTPVEPVVVTVEGANYQYQLLVNGQPTVVKGVGYNPQYAGRSPEERRKLYSRDFGQIRRAGIEMIQGWEPNEFDEVLLDVALANGLGVVVPFDLPIDGAYEDSSYRQTVLADVEEWVRRYKDHPALRMWGLGNEVIHGMKSVPRSQVFARFYVTLADRVHDLDPDHPVLYRDAEDVFVVPIRTAFQADRVERHWFIYGINIFTARIEDVVKGWQRHRFDVPVILSEWGPMGYPTADRPDGYRWMWSVIRSKPEMVLGGFAYVWFRDGPDPLDPMFGLVNEDGVPADGSLEAISQIYTAPAS